MKKDDYIPEVSDAASDINSKGKGKKSTNRSTKWPRIPESVSPPKKRSSRLAIKEPVGKIFTE